MLVEAAWVTIRQPGPLHAFGERIRARKGAQVAAVAVARKLACLSWQLLTKGEDYAFARPSLVRSKLRRLELNAGAASLPTRHGAQRISANAAEKAAERQLIEHAEAAYRRLIADWKATGPAKRAAARHVGAHLQGRQSPKQRGRPQPKHLRFSSSSPTPNTNHCTIPCNTPGGLDFHP